MKTPKMIKVIYNGEYLKNIYPHATTWQVIKYRVAILTRKSLIVGFILGAIYGSFKLGSSTTLPVYVKAEDKSQAMFDAKINGLKEEVANQLMKCESAGHSEDDGLVILDTNNKASIGQFQFQTSTVIHFYKTLYGKTITQKEATLIALDTTKAKELALDVMFKTTNKAGKDWVNCNNKLNLNEQIDMIKKLEK